LDHTGLNTPFAIIFSTASCRWPVRSRLQFARNLSTRLYPSIHKMHSQQLYRQWSCGQPAFAQPLLLTLPPVKMAGCNLHNWRNPLSGVGTIDADRAHKLLGQTGKFLPPYIQLWLAGYLQGFHIPGKPRLRMNS
jgi:hypothetical protein